MLGQKIAPTPGRARDRVAGKPRRKRDQQAVSHAEQWVRPDAEKHGSDDRRRRAMTDAKAERDDHDWQRREMSQEEPRQRSLAQHGEDSRSGEPAAHRNTDI